MSDEKANTGNRRKKMWWFVGVSACIVLILLILLMYWLIWGRFEERTSDAYVHGNIVQINSQVAGIISKINADDTQLIEEGKVLVAFDRTDPQIAMKSSLDNLGEVVREVSSWFQEVYQINAEIKSMQAQLEKAKIFVNDRSRLIYTGAISQENYVEAYTDAQYLEFSILAKTYELKRVLSLVQGTSVRTHPKVLKAIEDFKYNYVNLVRCDVMAPATGIVAQRYAQVGQWATKETPMMALVPLDQIWIDANFKEIHLKKIRIGQPATITSDIYGSDVVYHGTVVGIAAGTGEVFSPLPPQNATGNWIKIVQRVPVRIVIDSTMLKKYPLRLGLSMTVKVNVRSQAGPRVPEAALGVPIYSTKVFSEQEKGYEALAEEAIQKNIGFIGYLDESLFNGNCL